MHIIRSYYTCNSSLLASMIKERLILLTLLLSFHLLPPLQLHLTFCISTCVFVLIFCIMYCKWMRLITHVWIYIRIYNTIITIMVIIIATTLLLVLHHNVTKISLKCNKKFKQESKTISSFREKIKTNNH